MKDKTIFITGGNDGIGKVTALLFAQHGANVAIMGRREEQNERVKAIIESGGGKCFTFAGDVSKESDVKNAIGETFRYFGGLHYAFNNAGVSGVAKPLPDVTEEEYYAVADSHFKGMWLCMKYEIPYIIKSGGGAVVNNSSASGHTAARTLIYGASKHAIIGLTRSVALEYAKQNVRVNAVCPGATRTPGYERWAAKRPDVAAAVEAAHPMGRAVTCEEVALAVLYLCRDATCTTGSSLMVDGGYTVQ